MKNLQKILIELLGDIDPYPNLDLSKNFRPGFEDSTELKTFVIIFIDLCYYSINCSRADDIVKRVFTLEYSTRVYQLVFFILI